MKQLIRQKGDNRVRRREWMLYGVTTLSDLLLDKLDGELWDKAPKDIEWLNKIKESVC